MSKLFCFCFLLVSFGVVAFSQTVRPRVIGSFPKHGDENIIRNAFVSVMFRSAQTPLDSSTVNEKTVRMYPVGSPSASLKAFVIMRNDLHNITYEPHTLLAANTAYMFEVTAGVKDKKGVSIQPYSFIFNTGKIAYRKMITMNKDEAFGSKYESLAEEDPRDDDIQKLLDRMDLIAHVASGKFDPNTYSQAPNLPRIDLPNSPQDVEENRPLAISMDEIEAEMRTLNDGENAIAEAKPSSKKTKKSKKQKPKTEEEKPDSKLASNEPIADAVSTPKPKAVFNITGFKPSQNTNPQEIDLRLSYLPLIYNLDKEELPIPWNIIEGVMRTLSEEEALEEALSATDGDAENIDIYREMPAGRVNIPKEAIFQNKSLMIVFNFPEKTYIVFTLRTYTGEIVLTESGYVRPGQNERSVKTRGIPAGIYYAVIQTDEYKLTKKITILK